ncbi:MAG: tRNA uridine(34) 5-carboxymethylaminomethyl modification radical SAM/GNAT enzyme Elp3 [Candidatus Thermoplasmatota archaeon]|nr:tRNA uridine(34) 5-carboxymethylaminomethyl modification radical SAM/GNAT enzyme Elp3 [Candidatus Thermoplasmatota archaeon]
MKRDMWRSDPVLFRAVRDLVKEIISGEIMDQDALQRRKLEVVKVNALKEIPRNSMLLDLISMEFPEQRRSSLSLLLKKPSRTISGVAVVAAMTSPEGCPHGKCIFCPGGPDGGSPSPQSYTGREPAAMRGAQNDYDPLLQTMNRLEQLSYIGHSTDKVELIVMGGTFTSRDPDYQRSFVKGCLDAMNGHISTNVEEAQRMNESAPSRCVGITFETRPDRCHEKDIDLLLELGGTRVELGFQSAHDAALRASRRGHTVKDSVDATRRLKDSAMKVCYHIMPGMPGSTPRMDVATGRALFENELFRPDMLKIYPTLVIKGTELYDMWKRGDYEPYTTEEASEVVSRIKESVPEWVRIQRVQRDIPGPLVEAGVKKSNLRQIASSRLVERHAKCRCIRCREIGHMFDKLDEAHIKHSDEVSRTEYEASGGKEVFLSIETTGREALIAFLRLRRPGSPHRPELAGETALVRELKVFGPMVPIGSRSEDLWQHRGFGIRLLEEAWEIATNEWGCDRLAVNSGIGVRDYYRKLGHALKGPFMIRSS